jgi:2-C-methyl-D-erythritol 2,4-cyclodiphosphate synthase
MPFRTGIGYDAHRLAEGRPLVLGGVTIPHIYGLLGHSDADVLCHAIMDALLGAAALGDIGAIFPDTDAQYTGISSLILLEKVKNLVAARFYDIENIDATLIAQAPKLAPFRAEMVANIARTLRLPTDAVNVKFTTEEGLGFTGAGEGICANAICLIKRTDTKWK